MGRGRGDGRCSLEPNEPSLAVMTTRAQGAYFVISGLKKKVNKCSYKKIFLGRTDSDSLVLTKHLIMETFNKDHDQVYTSNLKDPPCLGGLSAQKFILSCFKF